MNQEKHWNKIGGKYEGEIFDVFKSDKNKVLTSYFRKHAKDTHHAVDFGCGVGKAFSYLSPAFEEVLALDISDECLSIARSKPYANISFKQADLSRSSVRLPVVDFVFCCNVIMLPEVEKNRLMFRNIAKALRPGGSALIVVPSLESIMFSSWRLINWYKKEGVKPEQIPESELKYFSAPKRSIIEGIIHIDGVPTKHYSDPELRVLMDEAGLAITALERLEYDWNTEFPFPPSWMKAPYPWDWLVECKKPDI